MPVRVIHVDGHWRVGPGVVAAIPSLYAAHGPGWIGERLPPVLMELRVLDVQAWQWIGLAVGGGLALVFALGLGALARRVALRFARRTRLRWDDLLVDAAAGPLRLLLGASTFAIRNNPLIPSVASSVTARSPAKSPSCAQAIPSGQALRELAAQPP